MVKPNIVAIVVTYHPDLSRLARLLDLLVPQVGQTVVVDNASEADLAVWFLQRQDSQIHFVRLDENVGIGAAQNVGIYHARKAGADYVLLSDQDSLPESHLVETLATIAEEKKKEGELIAAIGPTFFDERLSKSSRFLRTKAFVSRKQTRAAGEVVAVDHLIASGMLIPIAAIDRVGGMLEDLFVDYVDTEWSLRAEHRHGLVSYATFATALGHELGETPVRFAGGTFATHSPLRHYYLFRNSVWLWRQSWVPLGWKIARMPALILRLGFYVVFARPVVAQWRMIGLGIWHGLIGHTGKLNV